MAMAMSLLRALLVSLVLHSCCASLHGGRQSSLPVCAKILAGIGAHDAATLRDSVQLLSYHKRKERVRGLSTKCGCGCVLPSN